jgi:cytochrome P450
VAIRVAPNRTATRRLPFVSLAPMTAPVLTHAPELDGFRGLLHFAQDPLAALEQARQLHGPFVRYVQNSEQVRIVMDAALVDELLVKRSDCLEKDKFTEALKPILGVGLLTNEGASWKAQRKLLAPSFQPVHIRSYAETMVNATQRLISSFEPDGVRSVHIDMMGLTLEIVIETLFGTGAIGTATVGHLLEIAMDDYRRLTMSFRAAFPEWFPFWSRIRFGRVRKSLRHVIEQLIAERRKAPLSGDMLSRLLEARDDEGRGMSDEQLLDECITIMLAGHETTALALSFALHRLASEPTAKAALVREVDAVLAGKRASLEQVSELQVTRGVAREALRLYPPAWATGRVARQSFTLGNEPIAAGTQLMVPPWILHREARYFERPLEFRPERWWNGETETLPKGAYIPFGAGPRVCIGHHFAELEMALVLATLFQNCEFERVDDAPLRFSPSVTLRPAGDVRLRVRRRHPVV